MTYRRRAAFVSALAALPVYTAQAQSSADATVGVQVVSGSGPSVVNTAALDWGQRASGNAIRSSDVPTAASWTVDHMNVFIAYVYEFTLPSQLVSAAGNSISISFGPRSATSSNPYIWDPADPIRLQTPIFGPLHIHLGLDRKADGTSDVTVDLTGAPPGTYQGTVTLTVASP